MTVDRMAVDVDSPERLHRYRSQRPRRHHQRRGFPDFKATKSTGGNENTFILLPLPT